MTDTRVGWAIVLLGVACLLPAFWPIGGITVVLFWLWLQED